MATGLSTQLAKQVGEYLVAAELARRGLMAATFSGSVPEYDIIAVDRYGVTAPVQVKAIRGATWQFDIRRFAHVQLDGQRQTVGQPLVAPERLACVMVVLSPMYGADQFYVLSWAALQALVVQDYVAYLHKHGGTRPKRAESFHTAISVAKLLPHRDAWHTELRDRLGLAVDPPPNPSLQRTKPGRSPGFGR